MIVAEKPIVPAAPKYVFRVPGELIKALWAAALTYAMTFLANNDPSSVIDWHRFAISFMMGLFMALGPLVVAALGPGHIEAP